MKKSVFIIAIFALIAITAHAQQIDAAIGFGSVTTPSISSTSGDHFPQSIGGGTFISFSGDFLTHRHFGFGGEVSWRASRNYYVGTYPFRPIFYDFNGIYAPPLGKKVALDLQAGIGAESVRFYQSFYNYNPYTGSYSNYTSSNHFLGHFAGGIKFYPYGNFFIRPEAHIYLVRNNYEFSSAQANRFEVSIGYTFGR